VISVGSIAADKGARAYGAAKAALATWNLTLANELGPTILQNRSVSVQRTADMVTVTVTGKVVSVVPGINLSVEKTAAGPVERYVPPEREQ
jgi:NAD(P)-dependent dehydrogenase (short-subunit alcohol dehydrogenase family)